MGVIIVNHEGLVDFLRISMVTLAYYASLEHSAPVRNAINT